jgi:hypothetical protein
VINALDRTVRYDVIMNSFRFAVRPWTTVDEEQLRALIVSGLSVAEISISYQRSVAAIRPRSERLGITLKRVVVKWSND